MRLAPTHSRWSAPSHSQGPDLGPVAAHTWGRKGIYFSLSDSQGTSWLLRFVGMPEALSGKTWTGSQGGEGKKGRAKGPRVRGFSVITSQCRSVVECVLHVTHNRQPPVRILKHIFTYLTISQFQRHRKESTENSPAFPSRSSPPLGSPSLSFWHPSRNVLCPYKQTHSYTHSSLPHLLQKC